MNFLDSLAKKFHEKLMEVGRESFDNLRVKIAFWPFGHDYTVAILDNFSDTVLWQINVPTEYGENFTPSSMLAIYDSPEELAKKLRVLFSAESARCTCDSLELMWAGCKCGFLSSGKR